MGDVAFKIIVQVTLICRQRCIVMDNINKSSYLCEINWKVQQTIISINEIDLKVYVLLHIIENRKLSVVDVMVLNML